MTKFIEIDSETAQKLFGTLDKNVRIIEDKLKVRSELGGKSPSHMWLMLV